MPTDLPPDAERLLSRQCKTQGVNELSVPLADGWVQRAGRGTFENVDEPAAKGPCMLLDSAESLMYLLTYDQNPDAQCVRSGYFGVTCHARTLPPANSREAPYFGVALNWNRSRSTITQPCFIALGMSSGSWRLEQYADGRQATLVEVRDPSLKVGGSFAKIVIEVRGDTVSATVNGRPLFSSITVPPLSGKATSKALIGSVGVALFKARAQVKRFDVSPLEAPDGQQCA